MCPTSLPLRVMKRGKETENFKRTKKRGRAQKEKGEDGALFGLESDRYHQRSLCEHPDTVGGAMLSGVREAARALGWGGSLGNSAVDGEGRRVVIFTAAAAGALFFVVLPFQLLLLSLSLTPTTTTTTRSAGRGGARPPRPLCRAGSRSSSSSSSPPPSPPPPPFGCSFFFSSRASSSSSSASAAARAAATATPSGVSDFTAAVDADDNPSSDPSALLQEITAAVRASVSAALKARLKLKKERFGKEQYDGVARKAAAKIVEAEVKKHNEASVAASALGNPAPRFYLSDSKQEKIARLVEGYVKAAAASSAGR